MEMEMTQVEPNRCILCHTIYKYYGASSMWTYINNNGPICSDCIERGVNLIVYEDQRIDKVTTTGRSGW